MSSITSFSGQYEFLSNFFSSSVTYDGLTYPTVEHAYQASKCLSLEDRYLFVEGTPSQAKHKGRKVKLRSDWESVKLQIMTDLVRIKFNSHKDLKLKLLETGSSELVEGNYWNDTYWGVCRGVGENHLGKILMKVRSELSSGGTTI